MNSAYFTYKTFTSFLFFLIFPIVRLIQIFRGTDNSLSQRFGKYDYKWGNKHPADIPRIWIHAASVGEVGITENIIHKMKSMAPSLEVIVSTTTKTGQVLAQDKLGPKVTCIYAPLDFTFCVKKALHAVKPDTMLFVETEIWPNWLYTAQEMGIKTLFVNGRISVRSIKKYLATRSLFKVLLSRVDRFSMISLEDAERIRLMGAPEERIEINGNAKFDHLCRLPEQNNRIKIAEMMNLKGKEPVFVAGSTHSKEEEIVLDVYEKICEDFPDTMLILAPRHVTRAGQIERIVKDRGFDCQLRTSLDKQKRTSPVVIINTIGELQSIYSLATIVFCGGSLVPIGGHNIFEPAAWGKPVFFGPYMDDFREAKDLLEQTGGGRQVKDGSDLLKNARALLFNPDQAASMGAAAKKAVLANKGAAEKHAKVILEALQMGGHHAL